MSFKNIVKEGIHTKSKDLWSSDVFLIIACVIIIRCLKKSENENIFGKIASVIENFFNQV